jgi:hypothetical protein
MQIEKYFKSGFTFSESAHFNFLYFERIITLENGMEIVENEIYNSSLIYSPRVFITIKYPTEC